MVRAITGLKESKHSIITILAPDHYNWQRIRMVFAIFMQNHANDSEMAFFILTNENRNASAIVTIDKNRDRDYLRGQIVVFYHKNQASLICR